LQVSTELNVPLSSNRQTAAQTPDLAARATLSRTWERQLAPYPCTRRVAQA